MERININDYGSTMPEGMYITKKDADTIRFVSALFIVLTALLSLCSFKLNKKHK